MASIETPVPSWVQRFLLLGELYYISQLFAYCMRLYSDFGKASTLPRHYFSQLYGQDKSQHDRNDRSAFCRSDAILSRYSLLLRYCRRAYERLEAHPWLQGGFAFPCQVSSKLVTSIRGIPTLILLPRYMPNFAFVAKAHLAAMENGKELPGQREAYGT